MLNPTLTTDKRTLFASMTSPVGLCVTVSCLFVFWLFAIRPMFDEADEAKTAMAAEAKAVPVDLTKSAAIVVEVSGAKVEDLGWLPIVKELRVKNGTGLKAVVVALNGESFMGDHGTWRTAYVEDLVHEPYPGSYVQIGTGIGGIEPGYGYAHVYRMKPEETNALGAVSYFVGSGPVPGPDACVAYFKDREAKK